MCIKYFENVHFWKLPITKLAAHFCHGHYTSLLKNYAKTALKMKLKQDAVLTLVYIRNIMDLNNCYLAFTTACFWHNSEYAHA